MNNDNDVNIQILQLSDYPKYRDDMLKLYLNAFTVGEHAQYIDEAEALKTIDNLMHDGFAIVALLDRHLVGFSLYTSLNNDFEFPSQDVEDIDIDKSIYIAEVLVDKDQRGRGIATMMIESALQSKSSEYSHAVIRVWENNRPALLLYQKLSFSSIATISQTKLSSERKSFDMRKIYLAKRI